MMRHITMMWMMLELNNVDDHEGDLKVHMGLRIISVKINKLYISYNIRLVLYNIVYTILYNVVWANNTGYSSLIHDFGMEISMLELNIDFQDSKYEVNMTIKVIKMLIFYDQPFLITNSY